jgi:hypothetical protein
MLYMAARVLNVTPVAISVRKPTADEIRVLPAIRAAMRRPTAVAKRRLQPRAGAVLAQSVALPASIPG